MSKEYEGGFGFAFLVVLFILLIIVGSCYVGGGNNGYGHDYGYGCHY
ncbi:YjcZ family sporulation protein [Terribacillus saccharophilus]